MHRLYLRHLQGGALAPLTARMAAKLDASLVGADTAGGGDDLFAFVCEHMFRAGTDTLFGDGCATAEAATQFAAFDKMFPALAAGVPARLLSRAVSARDTLARMFLPTAHDARVCPIGFISDRQRVLGGRVPPADIAKFQTSIFWGAHANTLPATFWVYAQVSPALSIGSAEYLFLPA